MARTIKEIPKQVHFAVGQSRRGRELIRGPYSTRGAAGGRWSDYAFDAEKPFDVESYALIPVEKLARIRELLEEHANEDVATWPEAIDNMFGRTPDDAYYAGEEDGRARLSNEIIDILDGDDGDDQ